jgi:hypothetical protein
MNKKSNSNVLSIAKNLKNKRAINDTLNKLSKRKNISFEELDIIGDELLCLGEKSSANAIVNNFLEISDENVLMRYLYLFEYLNFDEFINPLIYSVLKRELSDNFKAGAINALYSFDIDITSPIFSKILSDGEKMFFAFDDDFFDHMEDEEDRFINAISWFSGLPYHKKMVVLNKLKGSNNKKKAVFLEIVANDFDHDLAIHAIDILSATDSLESVNALNNLAKEHDQTVRGKRALRALKKLRLLGFDYDSKLPPERSKRNYTSFVSMVDSNGNYVIWIAAPNNGKPPLEALCVLINEEEGVIDCFGSSRMTKKEFMSLIKKSKEEDYFIKIDYEFCLKLLKNGIYNTREAGNQLPLEFLYRKKIFNEPLFGNSYQPEFKEYDLKKLKTDKALLKKTAQVNDICGISSWAILTSNIFSYAEKFLDIKKKFSASSKKLKTDKLIENIFNHLVLPELDRIVKRLYFAADILRFDKKSRKSVNLILCAAENLKDPKEKPIKNPFITDFILTNVKNAAEIFKHK